MTTKQIANRLRQIESEIGELRRSIFYREAPQEELLPPTKEERAEATKWHGLNCPCGMCQGS